MNDADLLPSRPRRTPKEEDAYLAHLGLPVTPVDLILTALHEAEGSDQLDSSFTTGQIAMIRFILYRSAVDYFSQETRREMTIGAIRECQDNPTKYKDLRDALITLEEAL